MTKTTRPLATDNPNGPDNPVPSPATQTNVRLSETEYSDRVLASFPPDVRWMVRVFGD